MLCRSFEVFRLPAVLLAATATSALPAVAAPPPQLKVALGFAPIQKDVDYEKPPASDVDRCTVQADKYGSGTAWFVRNPEGQLLRRFADTNGDGVVDQWSYFNEGLEVYRDIDANFNESADQYRWFHNAGTRWGLDPDEDGKINSWKLISAQEVAEEAVNALRSKDADRFRALLVSKDELGHLGLGKELAGQLAGQITAAPGKFRQLFRDQKSLPATAKYVDFGASRPATVPAGTNDSTEDVTVYENVSALVATGDDHAQLFLGTLVEVGDGWRLLDAPTFDDDRSATFSLIATNTVATARPAPAGAPSEEMQKLMDQLEKLDAQAGKLPPDRQASVTAQRVKLLEKLASVTEDPALRIQWYQQMADMLSAAVQGGGYDEGLTLLERLERQLSAAGAGDNLLSYVQFRRMLAAYMLSQQQPNPDFVKIQSQWLKDLEAFADEFPESPDAAEALLQLGMSQEFAGQFEEAEKWYREVASNFRQSENGKKAVGALARLNSEGKPIRLRGSALSGGQVDLAGYRGKVVLIQYWATWCEPCKADMPHLKELFAKNRRRGFEIVGVCLDDDRGPAEAFVAQTKLPWKHIYEPGGLNGRLANEMGVMTLPLMMLVDQQGQVARRNLQAAELEGELQQLLK